MNEYAIAIKVNLTKRIAIFNVMATYFIENLDNDDDEIFKARIMKEYNLDELDYDSLYQAFLTILEPFG